MPMENLVWIDGEMTGLDLKTDALIEVAALVTDPNLNVLGDGIDVIIAPPEPALEQIATMYGRCIPLPVSLMSWRKV